MKSLRQHTGSLARDGLAAVLVLAVCCGSALADEPPPSPEDQARTLADEVLHRAGSSGPGDLGDWTKSVIGRTLERAGKVAPLSIGNPEAPPAPLPAERHAARTAAGLAAPGAASEILVFMSLSVPAASWRGWAGDAARMGIPLVLRGVGPEGFRETVREVGDRLGGFEAGVAIDPRLFRLFGIERVPAVAVVPGGGPGRSPVPPCASRSCAEDEPPPHDLVSGNIGIVAALEAVAAEGGAGRDTARRRLERLMGEGK